MASGRPAAAHPPASNRATVACVFLNLHERRLLRLVGLRGAQRRELLAVLVADGHAGGEVDLTAQEAGFNLAKRSVHDDLGPMFDRLMSPYELSVDKVVYGHRRYRKPVILAAALRQAGVTAAGYRRGSAAGIRDLARFTG